MAEWYVSSSEPENDEEGVKDEAEGVEIGGLRIPPSKVLELMQTVKKRKTLELDCLSNTHHKKRTKKKKHKRNKVIGSSSEATLGGAREEVSETASEIRSNTSTTATDCRDSRRPNLAMFDPTFDPELDDSLGSATKLVIKTKKAKAPPTRKHKDKKLASLERITANVIKSKQKWHKHQQAITNQEHTTTRVDNQVELNPPQPPVPVHSSPLGSSSLVNRPSGSGVNVDRHHMEMESSVMEVDNGFEERSRQQRELPSFRFDDDEEEEGMMSEMDMKFSVLSQIDRVEKLLDSEGLS